MLWSNLAFLSTLLTTTYAQSSSSNSSVVCIAGKCLQGSTNITIGVTLSADGAQSSLLLLPGEYTTTTNPQLLHDLLTSSSASVSGSAGFGNVSSSDKLSLPLDVELDKGLSVYADSLYSGSADFNALPTNITNATTPLDGKSFYLSSDVWAAITVGDTRVIFWDAVPDVSQLSLSGDIELHTIQSTKCSPACSGSGICTAEGTCSCPEGFTGSSCESCDSGRFGPECQACPSGCSKCDEGMTGTGICLSVDIENAPSNCNCLNGECNSSGQCTCNAGWTAGSNGTACASCSDGFFLNTTGDCKKCSLGCTDCDDSTGTCLTCESGFTLDSNDKTKCNAQSQVTSGGTTCPDGSYSDGTQCQSCDSACQKCKGGSSNDCTLCASGTYAFNGGCVSAGNDGVCEGGGLIADNNKHICDTCGAKCTSCEIPSFSAASTVDKVQCKTCLAGSFLSDGKCVDSCPSGTFVGSDNFTCTACDSSCSTCSGSADQCLTCANNKLASGGSCVSSCSDGTFSSSGSCLTCSPDCATCSGGSFNQCSSCPSDRPVLANGRCLPTCSKSQYFDETTTSCQSCDSSCSSCSGSGSGKCLACSNSKQVLQDGSCSDAGCDVVSGLGVCLDQLVIVPPEPSGTSSSTPVPTVTGIDEPTVPEPASSGTKLAWWQILLMALGCAFIFMFFLWCWRRKARKTRAKRTAQFASAKQLPHPGSWRYRLVRFGEKLFGHRRSHRAAPPYENENLKLMNLRAAEEARHEQDMDNLIGAYDYPRGSLKRQASSLSGPSLYSQVTGYTRKQPEVKQPVRNHDLRAPSSHRSSWSSAVSTGSLAPPKPMSDAEAYRHAVHSDDGHDEPNAVPGPSKQAGSYWLTPNYTGASGSKNPFRQQGNY